MSLLLCRQEKVGQPFFVEEMGIHLYSSQELCYVIFNHPLLVMDGFVNDRLLAFLRDELNLGFLALKLERWKKSGENPDEMLMTILTECDYYNSSEITRYRQLVGSLRKRHPAEFLRLKAGELFGLRQYGRAVPLYKEALAAPRDNVVDEVFLGKLWSSLGACYARMFLLEQAFDAYQRSYELDPRTRTLESLYHLTCLDSRLSLSAGQEEKITGDMRTLWDSDLAAAREHALRAPAAEQLEELFRRDPIKRRAGAAAMLYDWKKKYRNMA